MSFAARKRVSCRHLLSALVRRSDGPLRRGVAKTAADRYVKRYASLGLARALVAYFLLGLDSMGTLKQRLDHTPGLGRRLGLKGISLAQLLRLPHRRPSNLWLPLIAHLAGLVRSRFPDAGLRVLDTTFVVQGLKLFQRHHAKACSPETAGMKLGLAMDPVSRAPLACTCVVGQSPDLVCLEALVPPDQDIAGLLYLFHRGFRKYSFYDDLMRRGADFITPECGPTHYQVVQERALDPAAPQVLADQVVRLGSSDSHSLMRRRVRRIVVRKGQGREVFHTSLMGWQAWAVPELYRQRWKVEVTLRWLKGALSPLKPVGYTRAAAEHTFLAAIAVYLFVLLFAHQPGPPSSSPPFKATLERLRAAFFHPLQRQDLQALGFV